MYRIAADVHTADAERTLLDLAEEGRSAAQKRAEREAVARQRARADRQARDVAKARRERRNARWRAGRSVTPWGYGASWGSFVYFFFPINPGVFLAGGLAVLCGWLSNWSVALMVVGALLGIFWAPLAWLLSTTLGQRALRREQARLLALPFPVDGLLKTLGMSSPDKPHTQLKFAAEAPPARLISDLLAGVGMHAAATKTEHDALCLDVSLAKGGRRLLFTHDNRRVRERFWIMADEVLCKVHQVYPLSEVVVGER